MINWENYREQFPHIADQVYLNHAAIAPVNLRAHSALQDFYHQRMESNIEFWPEALERKKHFIQLIGQLIKAPSENIALSLNTSSGLNVLTLGLEWEKGDRILLNDFEFPSNVIPFLNLQRLGVEIDFVKHRNGRISLDDLFSKVTDKTRVISISFVEFMNGFRNDLKTIGEYCRERDIIFSVDSIQGLGAIEMDVAQMAIDFLSNGGHKWLMWPAGLGFIYISPRIIERVYPAQVGWLSVETPWNFFDYHQNLASSAQRFETGVFNTSGIISATATLEMMLEIGMENIEEKVLSNTEYVMNRLQQSGYQLYSIVEEKHRSGIVSFYHSKSDALFDFLKHHRITVSLREGKLRVSPHFYNNQEDLDILIDRIKLFDKIN